MRNELFFIFCPETDIVCSDE